FDRILAWEYTLLDPRAFWNLVPAKLLPFYSFYNTPISPDISHPSSLLRSIQQVAVEADFVSVKLDIDTPDTEIPIVLQIASQPHIARLIDEFFFELHFRCEILMYCGWGGSMPEQFEGLKLDRLNAMLLFADLRRQGIRSHVWP
ncbi:hypothetical protein B484DRAFT_328736, partial [Ochromonadaceae sp. CCMP2298]